MTRSIKHIFALILFLILLSQTAPTVLFGDGSLLVSSSYVLGIAHPTGHPLFSIVGKLASLIPFGSIPFRLNLLGALLGLASFYVLALLIEKLFRLVGPAGTDLQEWVVGIVASSVSFIFSIHEFMLKGSVGVETYALNLFLSLMVISAVAESWLPKKINDGYGEGRWIIAASFLIGIASGNHSLLIFSLFLSFAVYLLLRGKQHASIETMLLAFLGLIVGLSIYLYLPVRASVNPAINIGHPSGLSNFLWVITGEQFRENTFSMGSLPGNLSLERLLFTLRVTLGSVFKGSSLVFAPLFLIGLAHLFRRASKTFVFFSAVFIIEILPTLPPTVNIGRSLEARGIEGYYLVPIAVVFAVGSTGMYSLFGLICGRLPVVARKILPAFFSLTLCVLPLANHLVSSRPFSKPGCYSAHLFGKSMLESMSWGGLYLSITDAGNFIPLYLQSCEDMRLDIDTVNRSMLFHEMGLSLLAEGGIDLGIDWDGLKKGPLSTDEFDEYLAKASKTRPVYLETGSLHMPRRTELYPDLLLFGVGSSDERKIFDHYARSLALLSLLKQERDAGCVEGLKNYSIPFYNIGNMFLRKKEYSLASDHYRMALDLSPDFEEAAVNLMNAVVTSGKFSLAAIMGEEFKGRFKNPLIYYNYAISLVNLGEYLEGLAVLREAIGIFGEKRYLVDALGIIERKVNKR